MSYLSTTQNSLPVAGQALLHGILTRKVPVKGFKGVDYISFPFPKLCLAQLHRPTQVRTFPLLALFEKVSHAEVVNPRRFCTRRDDRQASYSGAFGLERC